MCVSFSDILSLDDLLPTDLYDLYEHVFQKLKDDKDSFTDLMSPAGLEAEWCYLEDTVQDRKN